MSSNFLDLAPGQLNRFIDDNLQPDEEFHRECSRNMDILASHLRNRSGFSVAETIKGGSLGKGTGIKGNSDLDVVMYLSDRFSTMAEFLREIPRVIKDLEREIRGWSGQKSGGIRLERNPTTRHAVKFIIQYGSEAMDVDLLPALNILREGKNTAYQRLDGLSAGEREYFSASLSSLQLEFVRRRPANVKNLIRLVKFWKKTEIPAGSCGIPTSYVLELLTIHAWEKAGSPQQFDTAKAFKSVLTMLTNYRNIEASWMENYNRHSYRNMETKKQGSKFGLVVLKINQSLVSLDPYILDPANPFNNVCARFDGWDVVRQTAEKSLRRPLLNTVRGMAHVWN